MNPFQIPTIQWLNTVCKTLTTPSSKSVFFTYLATKDCMSENFSVKEIFKMTRGMTIKEKVEWFSEYLEKDATQEFYMREVTSAADTSVHVIDKRTGGGKKMLMFGSNNYLGLANHPLLQEKINKKVQQYGIGLGGPPLLNGFSSIHKELEAKIARFKGKEDAMIFSSGYTANIGLVSGLLDRKDLIIYDEYCHASLMDGIKLSNATSMQFPHNNLQKLEDLLINYQNHFKNIFVAVEGLYSMDGDTCPLADMVATAKKYGAYTIVDDCHATGVIGETGIGASEKYKVLDSVDLVMGSFSKSFALTGGFVCGKHAFIKYLRVFSRAYMFSTSIPPILVAAILGSMEILEEQPELIAAVNRNAQLLVKKLEGICEFAASPEGSIVVIAVPAHADIIELNHEFHNRNLFVNSISYPAVPIDAQRIRISMMAGHTPEEIEYLATQVREIWQKFNLLKK
jgi:glycine C-acetyltransferase